MSPEGSHVRHRPCTSLHRRRVRGGTASRREWRAGGHGGSARERGSHRRIPRGAPAPPARRPLRQRTGNWRKRPRGRLVQAPRRHGSLRRTKRWGPYVSGRPGVGAPPARGVRSAAGGPGGVPAVATSSPTSRPLPASTTSTPPPTSPVLPQPAPPTSARTSTSRRSPVRIGRWLVCGALGLPLPGSLWTDVWVTPHV